MMTIQFVSPAGTIEIAAEKIHHRWWVDFTAIASKMGAKSRWTKVGLVWEFPKHSMIILNDKLRYEVNLQGQKRWRSEKFEKPMFFDGKRAMVLLDAVPDLCQQSFRFHRQRRTLYAESETTGKSGNERKVAARRETRDQKDWVSVEDVAKALSVTMFSNQANRFRLIMPDFTIFELRAGDYFVYKQNRPYSRLPDPLLIFSGSPYLTLSSLRTVFGVDIRWDHKSNSLVVPSRYGRTEQIQKISVYRLQYQGYAPQPFKLSLDEFHAFYQEPEPLYRYDHTEIYESIRDLFTNEPTHLLGGTVEDRISGEAILDLKGNSTGIPFEGRGAFGKVGRKSHVINGTAKWGFPLFQIQGGREYVTFGGLNNQFNLVDQIAVFHSSDHFGDNDDSFVVQARAGYGEHEFAAYLSTATFSQTVNYEQTFSNVAAEFGWRFAPRQRFSAKVDQYFFDNNAKGTESSYFDELLLQEILGDSTPITVDPQDQTALSQSFLAKNHSTTLFNLLYELEDALQVSGTVGASSYKNPSDVKRVNDTDALARLIVGGRKKRVDMSLERSGKNYRALGNPLRYQDRKIVRVAPYLDLSKVWKIYGDARREDTAVLESQGIPAYTNSYASLINQFLFPADSIRASVNAYDSTLYGKQVATDLNYTRFFGNHSVDIGGGPSSYKDSRGQTFRRSATGRLGFQLLFPDAKFSLGEEVTRHNYEQFNFTRFESLTTSTFNWYRFRSVFQYERKPKYYFTGIPLYTGSARIGLSVEKTRVFNLFYAASSLRKNLSSPEAWRVGLEYVYDFQ